MLVGALFIAVVLGSAVRRKDMVKAGQFPWALRFLEEPADIQFAHTRSAVLNCKVEDRPAATITWQIARSGQGVSGNITGVRHILPNGSLYFPAFSEGSFNPSVHRADYQCIAKNSVGKIVSRIAKLRAVIVQAYKVYAQDSLVIRGNTAVIKSVISAHARNYVRVVSWNDDSKDGLTLGGRFFLMPSGDLVITNVNDADIKALYYCTTINILTAEKSVSNPAKLFLKDQQTSPPRILNKALDVTVFEGNVSKLQCTAEGYPAPAVEEYSWKKDGVAIQMGNRFSRFAGGSLRIEQTKFEDQGLYECEVKNSRGSATLYIYLTVRVPLRFLVRPRRKVATASSTSGYIMECEVTGQPKANITWLQNGKPFTGNDRISIKPNGLEFAGIYSKDLGVYQCVADNGPEVIQSSAMLITAEHNPTVTSSAQKVILIPGNSLSEWCRAYSQGRPEITWYLDGVPLHDGNGYSITSTQLNQGTQSTLKSDTMSVEKTGEYKCIACNIGNCSSQAISVYIDGTLNITSIPLNANATKGQSFRLPCVAKGYPVPKVTWSRDGVRIPVDQRQSVSDDNTLHISSVQKGDSGQYKCTAQSSNKKEERIVAVTVFELPKPTIASQTWHEGKKGTLTCYTEFNAWWLKDGRSLTNTPPNLNIIEVAGSMSILQLQSLTAADSGKYTCIASNRAGTTSVSKEMVVYVPPKFIQEPDDKQVLKTYTISLTCLTSGTPPARIDWSKSKGGRFVPVSIGKPRFEKMVNGTLVIRNASEEDDGKYLCTASNGVSDNGVSRQVQLTVHVPARIVTAPANTPAKVSTDVTITCVAQGNLPIQLTWFNGTKQMSNNSRVTISTSTKKDDYKVQSTLVVERLVLEDTRQYWCGVGNEFGKDRKPFQIIAQKRPSPPSKPIVKGVTARSIYVTWTPRFDGNAPITEYTVEIKLSTKEWGDSERKVVRTLGLDATEFHPASSYDLRVYAANKVGMSDTSPVVTARTLEAAPSDPPRLINVTAVSSKEIYVRWEPPPLGSRNGVIRGYYVIYKQKNKWYRGNNLTVNGGETTSHIIPRLDPYTVYIIEIQAFTRAGVSPASKPRREERTHEDVPSQPPHSVMITILSSQSMEVTWSRLPSNAINGRLLGYRVYYHSLKNRAKVFNKTVTGPDERNATLTGLGKFTTYKISVVAFTRKGEGVRSPERGGTTLEDIPGRPSNVQAVPVSKQTIRVLWDPPLEPNGIIIAYLLYYSKAISDPLNINSDKVTIVRLNGNATSRYLPELEPVTEYYFWVKASTSIGFGNHSAVVRQTTQETIKANIFYDHLPVTLAKRSTSAILDCEAYGYPAPSVMWYSSGRDLSDKTKYRQLENGSLEIKHLTEEDAGEYECTASNRLGRKTVVRKLKVKTPPLPPRVIEFNVLDHTPALNITWSEWDDGNSPVTMFILEYKTNDGNWKVQYISNINYHVLHNVDFNKKYRFRISALNAVGRGKPSKVLEVTFGDGESVVVKEVVEAGFDETDAKSGKFYRNTTFLGVLIGVGALIVVVIVCLLLVAFRAGHLNVAKIQGWRKYWKDKLFREQLPAQQGDFVQRQSNPDQLEGSPSINGTIADSPSSPELMRSARGSEISLPRSVIRGNFIHEPIMEEDYPPPPPPYHSSTPGEPPPPEGSFSDTSSEGNFVQPVYHKPTLHDSDSTSRARRYVDVSDHTTYHPTLYNAQRSLNGTPGLGVLGFRGHADGGSELDTASISRGMESNFDLRHSAAASRLGRPSKSRAQSQELVHPVYIQSPAYAIQRPRDSGLGPSRSDLRRSGFNSKRGSSQVTPVQTPQRRESESSKECSPYHTFDRGYASRDPRAYDSASSEYSSSRDELMSALEFGKRHNLDKYYGIPTLETTSVSSNTTNSSDQDGICKFTASPRPSGDGCFEPTAVHAPSFNPRSRSRGNENYIYVLDPRRRGVDRGSVPQSNGSVV